MQEYLVVLSLALLPAFGNFLGGVIAELFDVSQRNLNRALHTAAGIVIAIVAVELMPEALKATSAWVIALSFSLGGVIYVVIQAIIDHLLEQKTGSPGRTGMWMVYVAVAVDLFSDGLMIGVGSSVSSSLALVLALGQVLADVPEGFATIANFKDKGVPRVKRLLLSASFAAPVLFSAILGFFLLRGQGATLKMGCLVFTAGLLTVGAIEDMISEAHEAAEDRGSSVLAFTGGFVLFTLVSAYLN